MSEQEQAQVELERSVQPTFKIIEAHQHFAKTAGLEFNISGPYWMISKGDKIIGAGTTQDTLEYFVEGCYQSSLIWKAWYETIKP